MRLSGVDMVVSVLPLCVPDNREFFIWSGYLSREIFVLLDELVQEKVPEYTSSFHVVCDSPLLVPCNMFIMRWLWFDKYCSWLFPLAEELERRVADAGLATPRYMGYVTEILMSVFIAHHKNDAKIALADRIVLT